MKRKFRKKLSIVLVFIMIFSLLPTSYTANEETRVLKMSNPDASKYTKELFAYLQDVGSDNVLFGQQHATDEGLTIKVENGDSNFVGSTQSEVKNAVGDYPAVFGWDTNSLDGRERPGNPISGEPLTQEQRTQNLAKSMITAHELGGIITLSMHPDNFVTGEYYGDTDGNVVKTILPGGVHHDDYNEWLDNIVDLSHLVVDEDGHHIPIIFRPFHEQNGSWFWWGASTTTPEQYKAIFRYTVEYLREHGANNFLIGFSPNGASAGDLEQYLETYPGDDYVDILGIDRYDTKSNAGSQEWLTAVAKDLAMISKEAEDRGKISAFTEFGYSPTGMNEEGNNLQWWEDLLSAIMDNPDYPEAANIAFMSTWANFGFPNNMYVPYRDIHGDLGGDHELLPTFEEFYNDESTLFSEEVKGQIYHSGKTLETAEHDSKMYTLSPTDGDTITENKVTLLTRVVNDDDATVTYSVDGSEEVEMELAGRYYTADWIPNALQNGGTANITIRHYDGNNNEVSKEVIRTYLRVPEILVEEITFDDSIEGALNKGTWPEVGVEFELSHEKLGGDGKLALSVSGMPEDEWWQELKIGFEDLSHVNFDVVNQVKFDVLLPETVADGAILSTVLAADGNTKYGEGTTERNVTDLEIIEIDGVEYKLYETTINLEESITEGTELGIIGKQLDFSNKLYLDNVRFLNAYLEAPTDPLLVDDFEGYLGDNDLLNRNYSNPGDRILISLSSEHKHSGEYGLQYDWTIGSSGYAGRQTSLGPVDWSGTNAFQFWLKHDDLPDNSLTVQIQMGGVSFEASTDLDESFEGIVTIPFVDFAPAHWEGNQTAIIDKPRLERVSQFALYMGGNEGSGTLYFDDLRAVYDEDAPPVPEREDAGEIEPIIYDFESDLDGWGTNMSLIKDGNLVHPVGLGEGNKTEIAKTSGYDLSGHNYIVATVKHDEEGTFGDDPLNAKLFIKTGSAWTWADSGDFSLNSDKYVEIVFDISDNAARENVQEIGLEFTAPAGSDGTSNAYIESIKILTALEELPDTEDPGETDEVQELKDLISDLKERIKELENNTDVEDFDKRVQELTNELNHLKAKYNDMEKLVPVIEQRLNELTHALNELREYISSESDEEKEKEKTNKNSNGESKEGTKEEAKDKSKDGDALPDTATNMFNYFLLGLVLLMIGGMTFVFSRKNRMIE
ncbi:glycosyl hydrolase [Evansella cellulosilytica]|uniref:LPXTG-motif cell wall anchor domain protein n=1 Tax=Evansella cellulosilytica (strain ATCC 21833 / DSM 2522 / FERM P-1141 / JCM 9156 / N-4) TaxID=649639 RepID=E6TTJ7_EVAC2|nr:glycosyl hydrolase [Evansella cellulosilytica]ADU29633.1 LPXTG-motif cell wall anchor domain protein [Evansella cellulosilytica DSM 2522]